MILICQNLRNNLQHPNEYIRGVTLRFLCRIREEELLEPLVPSVLANLEHRHSYVRKSAVLALAAIYRLPKGELLAPDAPELVERLLQQEQDASARRNAFAMLATADPDRALAYLFANADRVVEWGDVLQAAALDLVRRVCAARPEQKPRLIKVALALLAARSPAVLYDTASTLVALSAAPTAVRAAAGCFARLLVGQSDINVKLVALDRLEALKARHPEVVAELLMDLLRALATPNLDVRRRVLEVALDLVAARSVAAVVGVLRKEAARTQSHELEGAAEYRSLLVRAIHRCAVRFPAVAASVLHLLMDFLADAGAGAGSGLDVAHFIREIAETNPALHDDIVARLLDTFPTVRAPRVAACALWVLAEHCASSAEAAGALEMLRGCLGPLPLVREAGAAEGEGPEAAAAAADAAAAVAPPARAARPAVLPDGTYATQTAIPTGEERAAATPAGRGDEAVPSLRAALLGGDFFLGAVLASALTKLVLRLRANGDAPEAELNRRAAEAMLVIAAAMRLGESPGAAAHPLDDDSRARMATCLRVLAAPPGEAAGAAAVWLEGSRAAFQRLLADKAAREAAEARREAAALEAQPDEAIEFRALKSRRGAGGAADGAASAEAELAAATGAAEAGGAAGAARLARVVQLTGLSDPIYAEAYVTVHRYDIVLDVAVVNRSAATLQNVTLELATMGDLRLVERPASHTLAPGAARTIRANIKVSSTETGAIFGNLAFEPAGKAERAVVVLNDVHIDIMDYIAPAACADAAFRAMWAEFEWENKVAVNTAIADPRAFLAHIAASTNMRVLTPAAALEGECGYLAANLYARSVFGEDALVNVSVEVLPEGRLGGYIRIRSKTQGIALSLGDKLIVKSKG
jgi:coatomer subunit beta